MVSPEAHHEKLVKGLAEQLRPILNYSDQAIYLYLDDAHKACNMKLARMLGYKDPREWSKLEDPLDATVDAKSQNDVVKHYWKAKERRVASTFPVTVKKKSGIRIRATVTMVPLTYQGHMFVLQFISRR